MERTNVCELNLPEAVDLVSVDISLLSLRKVLPPVSQWITAKGQIVALVKPQYEAGSRLPKGGVVTDKALHKQILIELINWLPSEGLYPQALCRSEPKGSGGNEEFFVYLTTKENSDFGLEQSLSKLGL